MHAEGQLQVQCLSLLSASCGELAGCRKGFYAEEDVNAIRAMALFIRKHGKTELAAVLDRLHRQYDFRKIQEILGDNLEQGLAILEHF